MVSSRLGTTEYTCACITSNAVICQHALVGSYLRKPLRGSLSCLGAVSHWDTLMVLP